MNCVFFRYGVTLLEGGFIILKREIFIYVLNGKRSLSIDCVLGIVIGVVFVSAGFSV